MTLGAAEVFALAQESILVLVLDGHVRARADRVTRFEVALATVLGAYQGEAATREDRGVATRRRLDRMLEFLTSSEDVEEVLATADVLRGKLRWVLARHAGRPETARSRSSSARSGWAPPGSTSGSPGSSGAPAEARASDSPPPVPPEPDDGIDVD
jgi:hypothetical protein